MRHLRSFAFFAFAAMILSLAACQKTPDAELFLSNNDFSLDAQGGYINVSVSTNVNLTITISDSWITPDGALEGGSGTYGFTVAFNEGYEGRTGSITFSNAESGLSETVTISQKQQDAILLGGNEYRLFYEAQTLSLPVSSNVDYSVSITGCDWLKSMGTRGLTSKVLQFSVAENTGKEPREAIINITSGTLKQSIKVEQLPTTHFPETRNDWIESVKLNKDINKEKKEIFKEFDENGETDVNKMAEALSEIDGVIDVIPNSDGSVISIMQKDSIWMDIFLETPRVDRLTVSSGEDSPSAPKLLSANTRSTANPATRASGSNNIVKDGGKALILSPFQWELNYPTKEWFDILTEDFESVRLVQNPSESDEVASIDYFKGTELDDYDFIIILTHGGFSTEKKSTFGGDKDVEVNSLLSGTIYSEDKAEELRKQHYLVKTGTTRNSDKSYFKMVPSFLDNASFNKTAVILGACSSAKTRTMVDKFRKKGASFVSGFERVANTWTCEQYVDNMLLFLSNSLSYKDSHDLSAKSGLAKKVSELWMNSCLSDESGDEYYAYDLYNITSVFPEKPQEEYFFTNPYPVLKAPDKNDSSFSWTCSLSPCYSFWQYRSYYLNDGEKQRYWNYFECLYSVRYDLFIDGKLYKQTEEKNVFINNLAIGKHNAYVVANYIIDPEYGEKYPCKEVSYKSNEVSFTIDELKYVKVATGNAQAVTSQNAVIPFVSETNWNPAISQMGVVYSTSNSVPSINSPECTIKITGNTNIGASTIQLTGLKPKTLYYCRAYILLESGDVFYGSVIKFTTAEEVKKPAIAVDMPSLVFQDTQVGKTSTASFVITNTGTADLIVTLSGAGGVYSMDWTSGTITPNGGSKKVTVTFAPNKAADFSSTIKISSNAGSDKTISLSGKGISAAAETAKIKVTKTELTFKDRKNGESDTQSFTIMNTGTANLKVSISDPGAPFSLGWREKTIGPNHYESLSVVFAPDQAGDFKATLQISSNATNGTQHVTLTGKGLGGGEEQKPVIQVSTSSVLFGNVLVGNTGTQTITVSNTGNKALTINKITCPSGFSASWTSKTIASNGSEPLTITFTPTSAKAFSGNLVIESDASNGTSKTLTLSGTGVAKPEPRLSVSTNLVNFGEQILSNQNTRTLTITNSGTGTLEISSITKSSTYGDLFTISGWVSGGPITAGDSKTITISFMPIEERTYEETLTIVSSNAVGVRTQTVTLRGTGIPVPEDAKISFSASSLSWGSVEVGESVAKTFTISNPGSTALNISSIKVVASDNTQNPDYFTISPSSSCTINAGKSKSFTVTFSPKSAKSYSATVSIKSNATNATQGTSLLDLSGTGTEVQTPGYLEASPATLSYGDVTVGTALGNEAGRVVFTNTGGSDVSISSIDCPTGFSHSSALSFPIVVSPGNTKTITFAFKPTEVKSYSGYIQVNSNASNGVLKVKVTGNGVE